MLMIAEHRKVALWQTTGSRWRPGRGVLGRSACIRVVPGVLFDWTARGNPRMCVLQLLC